MPTCAVKRGFFVLRDCGGPAASQCSACQRPVCVQHMVARGPNMLCVECNARQQQISEREMRDRLQHPGDPSGVYDYRYGYYRNYGYNPFYSGLYYDSYYDEFDIRSFDRAQMDEFDDEEDKGAGFEDS